MKQKIDPIVEEIHKTRREIAKQFNFDIRKISEDAQRRQALEGRPLWQPESANQALQPTGAAISVYQDSKSLEAAPAAEL